MSDLFCPATVIVASCADVDHARTLASELADHRIAGVVSSDLPATQHVGHALAGALGVSLTTRRELREEGIDAAERLAGELRSLADLYRGEAVLVLSSAEATRAALPKLDAALRAPTPADGAKSASELWELSADADGWVLRLHRTHDATAPEQE